MKRICILGNSHAACWMVAWNTTKHLYPGYHLTFFMVGGYELGNLLIENGRLIAGNNKLKQQMQQSSGGLAEIDPDEFDHIVIVSLTFGYRNLTPLFKQCCSLATGHRNNCQLISDQLFEQAASDILHASLALKIARQLREITVKPITLAPAPCQSEDALQEKDIEIATLLDKVDILSNYYTLFCEQALCVAKSVNSDLLLQPEATFALPGYTKRELARNGINSTLTKAANNDVSHMNQQFGEIMIKQLLQRVEATRGDKAAI